MPKEVIRGTGDDYVVAVGWGAYSMQVGTQAAETRSLFWQMHSDEGDLQALGLGLRRLAQSGLPETAAELEESGRDLLNLLDDVSGGSYQGVWATLGRAECNQLIKLLRRARDSAFGRDE